MYIIVTPPYSHKSAGIRALHILQNELVRRGYDAITTNVAYNVTKDDIAVYPEVVKGNPLKAKRVIRWVLNTPGLLGGDKEYDPMEKIITWDIDYYPDVPVLRVPVIEPFFCNQHLERIRDCVWVGKGRNLALHPYNCVSITYQWPATRRELAVLLNNTKTLYTYDSCTCLVTEAVLCGCEVKIVTPSGIEDFNTDFSFGNLDEQISMFVNLWEAN